MIRQLFRFGTFLLASSLSFGQTQQNSSAWRPGPKTDVADVSTSAGADGSLAFAGKLSPARLYVTCSGAIPEMGKMVILKIVYRQPPGMPALSSSMKDMEHIDGVGKGAIATPQSMALQGVKAMGTGMTLKLQSLPEPIDAMLENTATSQETFVETYTTPAGQAEFRFPIPPSGPILKGVLDTCGFKPRLGSITPEFGQKIVPILQDVMKVKVHGSISPADSAALTKLQDNSKNQDELGVVNTISYTVGQYMLTEKKQSDVLKRNRCIQALIDHVQTGKTSARVDPCEALEPDMN